MVRQTVHFTGRVQGVGFRYTVSNIAERFAVSGFVQNLPDGRVRVVVEGDAEEILAFLDDIDRELSRNITDKSIDDGEPSGEFGDPNGDHTFTVRY